MWTGVGGLCASRTVVCRISAGRIRVYALRTDSTHIFHFYVVQSDVLHVIHESSRECTAPQKDTTFYIPTSADFVSSLGLPSSCDERATRARRSRSAGMDLSRPTGRRPDGLALATPSPSTRRVAVAKRLGRIGYAQGRVWPRCSNYRYIRRRRSDHACDASGVEYVSLTHRACEHLAAFFGGGGYSKHVIFMFPSLKALIGVGTFLGGRDA